jgi:hypothetical protein
MQRIAMKVGIQIARNLDTPVAVVFCETSQVGAGLLFFCLFALRDKGSASTPRFEPNAKAKRNKSITKARMVPACLLLFNLLLLLPKKQLQILWTLDNPSIVHRQHFESSSPGGQNFAF